MSDTVLRVDTLWKEYRLGALNHHTLALELQSWWAKVRGKDDPNMPLSACGVASGPDSQERFWALRDVSFAVKRGEVLGVIGENGAGKSTLLKILSRVTSPTRGEINYNGKIASLLEVGTGFHPELTGRENIFLNGAILGMSKSDIRRRFDEIVAFAEIDAFIDTPVKRYSSGMFVRLAFAVAAHLEPDILIVDEVLAVGDAQFQKKCIGKMEEVSATKGRTILFVSHNMAAVKTLCTRGLVLDRGQIAVYGDISDCIASYMFEDRGAGTIISHVTKSSHAVAIESITVNGSECDSQTLELNCRELALEIRGRILYPIPIDVELRIRDTQGVPLAFFSPGHERGYTGVKQPGAFVMRHTITLPRIARGTYIADISLTDPGKTGWVDFPSAFTLAVEGCAMQNGTVIEYKGGAGFVLLPSDTGTDC